ncbi:MAG TPA: HAD family hydrolase [Bacteroidales bacterium]|nr:HAD family hydrolase [Bacteroidales bacterium]
MESYNREHIIMAIAYDFDGTLAPGNMQEHSFLPELGIDKETFWAEANQMSKEGDMDGILAYMQLMLIKAREQNIILRRSDFEKYGRGIRFFAGVKEYFGLVNSFALSQGVILQHHIISSGLREFIAGTPIARYFRNIFASGFQYDMQGAAQWPALAINYTNKTQYLFRINKGIDNAYDNTLINRYMPEYMKPVPFSRIIYIGDGETDVPAMKMVKYQGGSTVAVYNPEPEANTEGVSQKQACLNLISQNRVDYVAPADYTENSPLFQLIKNLIMQIRLKEDLNAFK